MSTPEVGLPGDKSIAHRLLVLASLATGRSRVSGLPASLDLASTRRCLAAMGARIEDVDGGVEIEGPAAWATPDRPLRCGNSGTTARLFTGLAVGLGLGVELVGDASLSARPMDRVVYPLQAMGARIEYLAAPDRLPLRIHSRSSGGLRTLRYRPRVSSAQVRGALLLAALAGRADLVIVDRGRARDHTERLLAALGAPVRSAETPEGVEVELAGSDWNGTLSALDVTVPGDLSSGAFLIVGALLRGRGLKVRDVGLNPTRTGFLEVLAAMGSRVTTDVGATEAGEPVGCLRVDPARLGPFTIGPDMVPRLVDEIPALVVLASRVEGRSTVEGAGELRVKESDRLALLATNLRQLGVKVEETRDGLSVSGGRAPLRGTVRTEGDHRIAMAFGALGRAPGCTLEMDDPGCVDVSFPGYWDLLDRVAPREGAP